MSNNLLRITEKGFAKTLTVDNIANFFFDILHGKVEIPEISGSFALKDIVDRFQ